MIETKAAHTDLALSDQGRAIIQRIEALNYRSLHYVSQGLRPFEVLVGPNASGKSTFMDTITVVSDFIRDGLDQAILFSNGAGSERAGRLDELVFGASAPHFELAFELTVPGHLVRTRRIGNTRYNLDLARYELAIGTTKSGELDVRREVLWLIDSQKRGGREVKAGTAKQARNFPIGVSAPPTILHEARIAVQAGDVSVGQGLDYWRPVAAQDQANRGNALYRSETDNWSLTYRVGVRRSILTGLPEDPKRFPVAIWVRDTLRDSVRVLALNSAAMRRPVSPSASRAFDPAGANLPLVIQDLEKQDPTGYHDWLAHVRTILPDVASIHVHERPEDLYRYLAITYTTLPTPIPSWLISDGTLRVLALTVLAYLPEQPRIYLVEEPENGIHPRAIEGVYQSLSSVYRGQVLVATHSPLVLGLAKPSQILCFAKDEAGAATIIAGDQHPALQNWHGQTDLSTLYAAGVLG